MEWKVTNALSRDVERQQLNRILADIRSGMNDVQERAAAPTDDVRAIVGEMVEGNSEQGLSVTYNSQSGVLDFAVNDFIIRLAGDVSGQGTVSSLRDITIAVTIDPDKVGIPDAPIDNHAYWRLNGVWDAAADSLLELGNLRDVGFLTQSYDTVEGEVLWAVRQFEAVSGELVISNPTGEVGNPTYGLADLVDTGVGVSPLKLITRDAKGRVEGMQAATTDDLPEGATNLYFTTERDYLAAKALLIAGANILFTYDDVLFTITISGTGGGGGGGTVESVTGNTGVTVDNTDPNNPVVQLDSTSQASLLLADSSLQSGDNISELVNDSGYVPEAPVDGTPYTRQDAGWVPLVDGGGTVTQVDTGAGLTGGPITTTGTIELDSASIASLALADSALQAGDFIPATDIIGLALVATTGEYGDLLSLPTLGTASTYAYEDFDPAGAAAAAEAASEAYTDSALVNYTPTTGFGTAAFTDSTDYATAAQGALADTALQTAVLSVVAGTNVTVDNTDPENPVVSADGGGSGTVVSVVEGVGIDVDATDPANPVVNLDSTTLVTLAALADFATLSPTDGDIIEYDGTAGAWAVTKDPRELYLDGGNF